jgi:CRP/FNR family cyclic AMP-dependent transcriptional regulator
MTARTARDTTKPPRLPGERLFLMPSTAPQQLHGHSTATNPLPDQVPAFDLRSPLNKFIPGKSRCEYRSGESIFSQGDPASAVFYIESGKVKLTVVSASGKEAVIAHLLAGSFFGESSLAGELQQSFSVEALQSSSIVRIEKRVMHDLLHREHEFAQHFRAHLLSRNIRMQADLVDHLFNSSEKRLARLLMMMANFGQNSKPIPVIARISQETLANMIGTTRSRVSRFLNRFRDLGYIDYNCEGMVINSSLVNILLLD